MRQARGGGHGHSHFGGGHGHGANPDDHGGHDHASEAKRIDTGRGVLVLEVFEDGVPPRFRLRASGAPESLPRAGALSLETVRAGGTRQTFSFVDRSTYVESVEEIPEPHEFTARLRIAHGAHAHHHKVRFEEHTHADAGQPVAPARVGVATSDRAAILSLFTLLTFSPCEGFLPVYLAMSQTQLQV